MEYFRSLDELRAHYKPVHELALKKELRFLDPHARNFLSKCPFVLIGSQDGEGNADVTPKGDKPGFVSVLDDVTIAIPDRPGNNRLDTFENIVANPAVGLLFLIPGMNETLRINGEGRITADAGLREKLAVDGRQPATVLVVKAKAVYMHCAKAFMRSELWKPESWHARDDMPSLGAILRDHAALAETAGELDERLDESYAKSMW